MPGTVSTLYIESSLVLSTIPKVDAAAFPMFYMEVDGICPHLDCAGCTF